MLFKIKLFLTKLKSKLRLSSVEYITIESYKDEIKKVNNEIDSINYTIKYYKNRRESLSDYKHSLELEINKFDELNICSNCRYYHQEYCEKFKSSVVFDASCKDFEWK